MKEYRVRIADQLLSESLEAFILRPWLFAICVFMPMP